jgi:hypothetical protein
MKNVNDENDDDEDDKLFTFSWAKLRMITANITLFRENTMVCYLAL